MPDITLYSTGCPRCSVLKKKLEQSGMPFRVVDSIDEMLSLGIKSAPMLDAGDGSLMDFAAAVQWLNKL